MANGGTSPDGRTSAGLSGAVKALGTETTPGTLIYGTDQISQNMFTLVTAMYNIADGAGQLSDGAQQLSSGASQLADGTQQLSDGAVQLADGAQSAYDGSQQLADGLAQFNDEGISKITELGDTLSSFKTRMDILKEVGDDHTNFSGITEGSVKYIYETDALKQD